MRVSEVMIEVINPATEEIIDVVPRGTNTDVHDAVSSAREAFREWRWIPAVEKVTRAHNTMEGDK